LNIRKGQRPAIEAVVFDLDGVLLQSEEVWDAVRESYTREHGGRYSPDIQRAMMGMNSKEWSRYLHDVAGVPDQPAAINDEVVGRVLDSYRTHLPLIDGATDAVRRLAAAFPLGLASSSNRPVIDAVLDIAGLTPFFRATVSSEEVPRGKPAPDVYEEAARRLGADPVRCAAVEDSHNGIRSAKAAGMCVIAIPNQRYPPDHAALTKTDLTINTLDDLTVDLIEGASQTTQRQ
jgi:HAD superfamily hydrolase (TIGR01509 family)